MTISKAEILRAVRDQVCAAHQPNVRDVLIRVARSFTARATSSRAAVEAVDYGTRVKQPVEWIAIGGSPVDVVAARAEHAARASR